MIGGLDIVLGEARIQLPFSKLGIVMDAFFSILAEKAPSLLSNQDMIENSFGISIKGRYLYIGPHRQPLELENYFFV